MTTIDASLLRARYTCLAVDTMNLPQVRLCRHNRLAPGRKEGPLFICEWLKDRTLIPREIRVFVLMKNAKVPVDVGLTRCLLTLR
jgi:hypothetical protein